MAPSHCLPCGPYCRGGPCLPHCTYRFAPRGPLEWTAPPYSQPPDAPYPAESYPDVVHHAPYPDGPYYPPGPHYPPGPQHYPHPHYPHGPHYPPNPHHPHGPHYPHNPQYQSNNQDPLMR